MLTEPAGENQWHALVRPGRKVAIGERLVFPAQDGTIALEAEVLERGQFGDRLLAIRSCRGFLRHPRAHRPRPAAAVYPSRRRGYAIASATRRCSRASAARWLHPPRDCTSRRRCWTRFRSARSRDCARNAARRTGHVCAACALSASTRFICIGNATAFRREAADALNRARSEGRRIVAVGTTVVRTLESAALRAGSASDHAALRRYGNLYLAGIRLPGGRRAVDELPPAAIEPADAGERLRRAGARPGRLSAMRSSSGIVFSATATACFSHRQHQSL